MTSASTTDNTRLTDVDRDLIKAAREIGISLRTRSGEEARLAGWLLTWLADLAERLDACKDKRK